MGDELEQIRRDTNNEPAPHPEAPPPMACPACSKELAEDGSCKNEECENFAL